MKKKRLAFYYHLPFGGALNTMDEFIKRLSKNYDIDLYTMEGQKTAVAAKYTHNIYRYELKVKKYINGGPLLRLQEDYLFFFHLRTLHKTIAKDIDMRKYDCVLVSHDKNCQTPFLLQYLNTKSLYYCQEPTRMYFEYALNPTNTMKWSMKKAYLLFSDYIRKLAEIKNARSVTKILSNSYSSNESIYRAYGIYPSVCHLGTDPDIFVPLNIKKENFIYEIGNLSLHKGHRFIIDAVSLITESKRPKLIIATGGIDVKNSNNLYQYAHRKKVDLQIQEKISSDEHIVMYNKAKATICAAHLETLGLSALESMACGTPVIAIKEGGYRDVIIDGKTGFFVDRNIHALAQKIQDLLEDKLPLDNIITKARKSLIPYWTWDQAVLRLIQYLENI